MKSFAPVKVVYIVFGIILFAAGTIGTIVPLVPTTPLMILAAVCFGKSSRKIHTWCVSTKFYRNNVEDFINKRSMTLKMKIILLSSITFLMGLSYAIMTIFHTPLFLRLILIFIWLCHVLYFSVKVKTEKPNNTDQ